MFHDIQLGFERHQKYLLVATKTSEDGTTIHAKIQATTIFLFTLINLQTTKNKIKIQWCINAFRKFYRPQSKNIKIQWCIDALSTLATTKQK